MPSVSAVDEHGPARGKETPEPPFGDVEPPPKRFTAAAKEAWASAPETVRAEVVRMEKELTAGLKKHQAAAARDADLAGFHDRATKGGTTLKEALTKYVALEDMLRTDFLKGLELICQNVGFSLRDIAASVLGQVPSSSSADATAEAVMKFADAHPRFEELSEDIVFFLDTRRANDLAEAYSLAERFNLAHSEADLVGDGKRAN
jgi:hypothetical protein